MPVEFIDIPDHRSDWGYVALLAFEFRHAAEATFPNTAARSVCEIGVVDGIPIFDLIEDAVDGHGQHGRSDDVRYVDRGVLSFIQGHTAAEILANEDAVFCLNAFLGIR